MQIVIEIDEQDYVYIAKKHCLPSCDDKTLRKNVYEMIANGIPLPEMHGRLIDAEQAEQILCIDKCREVMGNCHHIVPCYTKQILHLADTVVLEKKGEKA